MALKLARNLICLLIFFLLLSGLSHIEAEENPQDSPAEQETNSEGLTRIKEAFKQINELNETTKKSPEWLREAYSGIKIKRLNDIPKEEYGAYKKRLYKGQIYIIVHPGFYSFFANKNAPEPKERIDAFPAKNLADRIFSDAPTDSLGLKLAQENERLLRNFLEYMSLEKKLVILILPRDYKKYLTNGYSPGLDEYARYLNDLTNGSESILYMESRNHNTGDMEKDDVEILSAFLKDIKAKRILYSGGFVGRCLDKFNTVLVDKFGYKDLYFVPELASIFPGELNASHSYLLTETGKINFKGVATFFKAQDFERVLKPKIKHSHLIRALEKIEKVQAGNKS
ncbi:MAG: hypothetical protein EPN94_02800 [Nitrospirae bacterium]|nr:MAG: hypothetical protein EPN94_02800 [Nitrospirota bacterium]